MPQRHRDQDQQAMIALREVHNGGHNGQLNAHVQEAHEGPSH